MFISNAASTANRILKPWLGWMPGYNIAERLVVCLFATSTVPAILNVTSPTTPSNMTMNLAPDTVVIHTNALEAALANLNVTDITATQLLDAIKEDSKNRPTISGQTNTLLELIRNPPHVQNGSLPLYESTIIMRSVGREEKARRLEQLNHFRKNFPDGKVPNPNTFVWLHRSDGQVEMGYLPFIRATIRISPYEWDHNTPEPEQVFQDVWCLWDTGAQVSQILTSRLRDDIRKENGVVKPSGYAEAKVRFHGVDLDIRTTIAFRETMPNETTFIILGQYALINSIQYHVQPTIINPALLTLNPNSYGQMELVSYRDPATPGTPLHFF